MRYLLLIGSILVLSIITSKIAHATSVDVYAEGGYSDTSTTIKIFADINSDLQGGPLRSAGVKLIYPIEKLTNALAFKNEDDWYFGLRNSNFPYAAPDTSVEGEVIFLLGILDENDPGYGLEGKRILLGSVIFERKPNSAIPLAGEFALSQGKGTPFIDFATTLGQELDDAVVFLSPTMSSQARLNLMGTIRVLQMITDHETDIPIRPAELDINNDGQVGLEEAIDLMRDISD
jgi:hypothetical protein